MRKKARLDYVMATPTLLANINNFRHFFHGFDISDHSSSIFSVDFEKADRGKGTFRAHPSILKHPNYTTLIHNVIKFGILDGLEDKEGEFFIKTLHNLKIHTSLQEDLIEVEMLGKETGWPVTDQLLELNDQLNQLRAEEPRISKILTNLLSTDI